MDQAKSREDRRGVDTPSALPPPQIPDHELLRPIGRGAYGEVWLARSVTGAFRAVKIVRRSSFAHDRPFEREFEGILKFEPISRTHASQVDILHVGRNGDYFYYVMELADDQVTGGQIDPEQYTPRTLKSDLELQPRLSFEECVAIGIALTTALEHLHANALVHRDVKPSNIIFVNGVAKLADIGLVTGVDTTRSYVGTEGFAAPEGPGTPQGDLFSLGKVLYEMATGKDRQEFPELPTNLREMPEQDGLLELNAVIARACRHDPNDRYRSAAAMRSDLELLQSGKSLARLHRTEARLRWMQRVGAVTAVLALLIGAGWLWQARQTRTLQQLAADKARLATQNQERLLQLNLANGLRDMESGDIGSAMVWLADGLKYATNDPAQADLYRLRFSILLQSHPKPLATALLSVPTNAGHELSIGFSRNGKRILVDAMQREGRRVKPVPHYARELWELALPPRRLALLPSHDVWPAWALSPDGQVLFSSREKPGQEIWKIGSDGEVQVTKMNHGILKHLRFVQQGKAIVGVDGQGAMRLFEAESGRFLREVTRFSEATEALYVPGQGEHVLAYFVSKRVRLIELENGRTLGEVQLDPWTQSLKHSSNGRFLLALPPGGTAQPVPAGQLWDLVAGRRAGPPLSQIDWRYAGGSFSRDGRWLAIADGEGQVQVVNALTADPITPILPFNGRLRILEFSGDNLRLAIADWSGLVHVYDLLSGTLMVPPLQVGLLAALEFVLDDAALLTIGEDGLVRLWDLTAPQRGGAMLQAAGRPRALRFSPDGELLLAGGSKTIQLWHTTNWERAAEIELPSGRFNGITFSRDGQFLVLGEGAQGARVWNARTGLPAGPSLHHGTNRVLDASFSRDDRWLATVARGDSEVRLWDWRTGVEARPRIKHRWPLEEVSFYEGGLLGTLSANDRQFVGMLWDLQRNTVRFESPTIPRHSPSAPLMAGFIPSASRWVFRTKSPHQAQIANTGTGQLLPSILAHEDAITMMDFCADSRRILTGGHDRAVRVWDIVSGEPVLRSLRLPDPPREARFSPDGRVIATLTINGSAQLWDAQNGQPLSPALPLRAERLAVHKDSRTLALCSDQGQITVMRTALDVPAESLEPLAWLAAGRRLVEGEVQPVPSAELLALHARMQARHPALFDLPANRLALWHGAQVSDYGPLHELDASIFHLERQLALAPDNHEAPAQLRRLRAKKIPARDPADPAELIDLTAYYTHPLDFGANEELRKLPRGRQLLAGTDFDLRGLILLQPKMPLHPFRQRLRVSGIRVGQPCRRLHFLQGCDGDGAVAGSEICRMIIHYADGSHRVQSMVYSRDLSNWWNFGGTAKPSAATVAWEGKSKTASGRGAVIQLFQSTWDNPTPAVEVTQLDFELGDTPVRPFLVAVTAE